MKQVRRAWVGSTITLLCVSLFLAGCPKRPEVAETAPKPIGPQGAIAMPAPPPAPPTVSAVPPTVPAPPDEKSVAEVTAQAQEAEAAREAKVQEAEAFPAQEAPTAPEAGIAPESQPAEAEVTPGARVKEGEMKPEAQTKEGEAPAPVIGAEAKPEAAAQAKESEVTSGAEAQVRGAEVAPAPAITAPSAEAPPTEGVSPAPPVEPVVPAPVPTPTPPPPPPAVAEAPKVPELTVKDIYFDFDQAVIRDDARKTLADNIQWLRTNSAGKVTIEGHCDERGSSEYNLALGERRARVTRDFLVAAGIEVNRISTISFGKERPFVLGHDESAWKWNRRAHFVLTAK